MYVLQLTSGLGLVCLFCPAYAEVFKYSGMYLPILKAAGQSNKKCGCFVLLLYDVWHNFVPVRFLFSFFLELKKQ